METKKPLIALTMGDSAGIGPEIIVKALQSSSVNNICKPLVVGDASCLQGAIQLLRSDEKIHHVNYPEDFNIQKGVINVLDLHNIDRNAGFPLTSGTLESPNPLDFFHKTRRTCRTSPDLPPQRPGSKYNAPTHPVRPPLSGLRDRG